MFETQMKHAIKHLQLLKPSIILGEIQSKCSRNFRIIKITFPNLQLQGFYVDLIFHPRFKCFMYPYSFFAELVENFDEPSKAEGV